MRHLAIIACGALALFVSAARAETPDMTAFKSGATTVYSSAGHVAADKTTVTFKYPSTWRIIDIGVDIDGQGVVAPDNNRICMVLIREDPQFTAAAFKELFANETEVRGLTPDDSTYVSSQPLTLTGRPSVEIISASPPQTADDVPLRTMANFIGDEGVMVSFQCMTSGDDLAQASAAFDEALPLFRQMSASVAVQIK